MRRLLFLAPLVLFGVGCVNAKIAKIDERLAQIKQERAVLQEKKAVAVKAEEPAKIENINAELAALDKEETELRKEREELAEKAKLGGNIFAALAVALGAIFGIPALAGVGELGKRLLTPPEPITDT